MGFWKQVKSAASSAASEAEKQATIGRLTLEANGIKSNLRKKHEELGDVTLKLVRAGDLSHIDFAPIMEEITQIEKHAAEVDAQIAGMRSG